MEWKISVTGSDGASEAFIAPAPGTAVSSRTIRHSVLVTLARDRLL